MAGYQVRIAPGKPCKRRAWFCAIYQFRGGTIASHSHKHAKSTFINQCICQGGGRNQIGEYLHLKSLPLKQFCQALYIMLCISCPGMGVMEDYYVISPTWLYFNCF